MAKLQWLGLAAWATVEDKWMLCSFGGGGCLCTVASFHRALGRLDPSGELFKPMYLFSCAVLMQITQGYSSCAEVCRGMQRCAAPKGPPAFAGAVNGELFVSVLHFATGSVFHPCDPAGWHKDKQ